MAFGGTGPQWILTDAELVDPIFTSLASEKVCVDNPSVSFHQ